MKNFARTVSSADRKGTSQETVRELNLLPRARKLSLVRQTRRGCWCETTSSLNEKFYVSRERNRKVRSASKGFCIEIIEGLRPCKKMQTLGSRGSGKRTLVSSIKENGGIPILLGYPLERSGYTADHRIILEAVSQTLDVLIFDPQPKMEEAARTGQYYFSRDRGHANVEGNDQIAKWVFEFLKEKNLLGNK